MTPTRRKKKAKAYSETMWIAIGKKNGMFLPWGWGETQRCVKNNMQAATPGWKRCEYRIVPIRITELKGPRK